MGGYVSRTEKATGTMHRLFARVFVLSPDPLVIVVLDFFTLPIKEKIARPELIARIRDAENLMGSLSIGHGHQRKLITRVEALRELLDEEGRAFSPHVEFSVVSLGGKVLLVAVPLELFPETEQLIGESFPDREIFVLCYANNYQGYLVPKSRINQEYESLVSPYAAEAEEVLVSAIALTARKILR